MPITAPQNGRDNWQQLQQLDARLRDVESQLSASLPLLTIPTGTSVSIQMGTATSVGSTKSVLTKKAAPQTSSLHALARYDKGNLASLIGTTPVASGGTGAISLTAHGVLVGEGTSAVVSLAVATNGQLIIGSTGADPVVAALSAGDGITITNGAGSITITWNAAEVATGGGASATLGTIGGSGPATSTMNDWLKVTDAGGNIRFIPAWT